MICWRCAAGIGAAGGLGPSKFPDLWVCVRCRRFEDLVPASASRSTRIDAAGVTAEVQGSLFGPDDLVQLGKLNWVASGSGVSRSFTLARGSHLVECHVDHCGHPTALRPWGVYVHGNFTARAFEHLGRAQSFALELFEPGATAVNTCIERNRAP